MPRLSTFPLWVSNLFYSVYETQLLQFKQSSFFLVHKIILLILFSLFFNCTRIFMLFSVFTGPIIVLTVFLSTCKNFAHLPKSCSRQISQLLLFEGSKCIIYSMTKIPLHILLDDVLCPNIQSLFFS